MALEHGARDTTQDLDVLMHSGSGDIRLCASQISTLYGIADDWINDAGSKFVTPEIMAASKVFWELPNLKILTPPADALLAMKVLAMRIDRRHPDRSDIVFLINQLKLHDVDAILALVKKYLPEFANDLTTDHKDYLELFVAEARRQ
ncbi:MAG: hypothetical protein LBL86_06940 [Coriobacteriales bacterium]|nr:hypothetical protein [Coriobacteriales bacterium]